MVDIDKAHFKPSNQPYCEDCGRQKYTHQFRCQSCGGRIVYGTEDDVQKARGQRQ